MQMNDSQRIPASKEKVWAALNDPEILKQCIPGCQSLEMSSPTEMTATVVFKVGPVKATFGGKVTLSDLDPPNSYRISGEGSGGVAGFAKGGAHGEARERRVPTSRCCIYEVDAQIGGKLAQLGSRLINSTAKKLAGEFFASFGQVVGGAAAAPAEAAPKGWLGKLTGAVYQIILVLKQSSGNAPKAAAVFSAQACQRYLYRSNSASARAIVSAIAALTFLSTRQSG